MMESSTAVPHQTAKHTVIVVTAATTHVNFLVRIVGIYINEKAKLEPHTVGCRLDEVRPHCAADD